MAPEIDLNFLARQFERVLTEIGSLRDEVRVQGASIMRLDALILRSDGIQTTMLEELRAIRDQVSRMNDRIRKVEDVR
jgi:hypothetical protein